MSVSSVNSALSTLESSTSASRRSCLAPDLHYSTWNFHPPMAVDVKSAHAPVFPAIKEMCLEGSGTQNQGEAFNIV